MPTGNRLLPRLAGQLPRPHISCDNLWPMLVRYRYIGPAEKLAVWLALTVVVQAAQLPMRVYTTADGLAGDTVNCIVQDSHGFIWFCTNEGLSRFDGYRFQNFGADQGLPGVVNDLLAAGSGEYWIGGSSAVYRFNPAASGRSPWCCGFMMTERVCRPRRPDPAAAMASAAYRPAPRCCAAISPSPRNRARALRLPSASPHDLWGRLVARPLSTVTKPSKWMVTGIRIRSKLIDSPIKCPDSPHRSAWPSSRISAKSAMA